MKELFKVKFEITVEAAKGAEEFIESAGAIIKEGLKSYFKDDEDDK